MATKHYVEIFYPGSFFAETSEEEVSSRVDFKLPSRAYGYRFFDKEVVEQGGETLSGSKKNFSGMYFRGTKYSVEELKQMNLPDTLIRNIEGNGYKFAVKTVQGNWQPVSDRDVVIP